MSNGGLISGAFSSASGKADIVMDENGQILYYNNGRKALDKEDNDDVLTLKLGLPSWEPAAAGGLWSVLGDYEATEAESTHTFSFTAVNFDDDAYLFLEIDGYATAQFALYLRPDNKTSAYYLDGIRMSGGALTALDNSNVAQFEILSTTAINGVTPFHGTIKIFLTKGGTTNRHTMISDFSCPASDVAEKMAGSQTSDETDISSLVVLTSTSSWQTGTRMTLYKIARA